MAGSSQLGSYPRSCVFPYGLSEGEQGRLQYMLFGTPCGSDGKESACNAGDPGLIPGSGRSPGEGDGYPLQFSCLENPMDRGAWWATVHGACKKSNMTKQLTHTNTHTDVGAYIHMHVHTHTY